MHDEIVVEAHGYETRKAARICQNMTSGILPIKLPVEVSYGTNWEEQEDWE